MGDLPIKPIEVELERILGISFPDQAEVLATEDGGIVARASGPVGKMVVEVNNKGEHFISSECSDLGRAIPFLTYLSDGRTAIATPLCSDYYREQQSGLVSQDKLRQARAILLKKGKVETTPSPSEGKEPAQTLTNLPALAQPVAKK